MISETQCTEKDKSKILSRYFCGLGFKSILKFLSSLLLPMVLGVFTLVITLQQQELAKKQREEDRNASRQQRIEDQQAAAELRNLEKHLSSDRYYAEVLDGYIKETGDILDKYNGSLTLGEFTATLIRAKTLNAFRKLDSQRNAHIIRFLHEAKQLPFEQGDLVLDLSTAKLRNIDFRDLAVDEKHLRSLSLIGIILSNATLINLHLKHINFDRTQFNMVEFSNVHYYDGSFIEARLNYVNFSSNHLETLNFLSAELSHVVFSAYLFKNISFSSAKLHSIDFSGIHLDNVDFRSSELRNIDFSNSQLESVDFTDTRLYNVDFSYSSMKNVIFSPHLMSNVTFVQSHIDNIQLTCRTLYSVNFSNLEIKHMDFNSSVLENVDFSFSRLKYSDFSSAQLINVNFLSASLASATFKQANASYTNFQEAHCVGTDFEHAILNGASFQFSNAKHATFVKANLSNVTFKGANLYSARFTSTGITDRQLSDALSIQNALASSGARLNDRNMINNGYADCQTPLTDSWSLEQGLVSIAESNPKARNCRFVLESFTTGATMLQRVSLLDKWNYKKWPYSQLILKAELSEGVQVEIRMVDINSSVIKLDQLDSEQSQTNIILYNEMREVEIFVKFIKSKDGAPTKRWCDNLQLFIIYDAYDEFQLIVPYIPTNARWSHDNVTVYGSNEGNGTNQLSNPTGIFVDEYQTAYIADTGNDRILQWKQGELRGTVVAGGNGRGNQSDQLNEPTYALLFKKERVLVICDGSNNRIVKWSVHSQFTSGEIFIANIECWGLAMDDHGNLYVSDRNKNAIQLYHIENNNRLLVVAGDKGSGMELDQFHSPMFIFVDRKQTVYVSDWGNRRVMKWSKQATNGIIVVGDPPESNVSTDFFYPTGIFVDFSGTLFVADSWNNRILCLHQNVLESISVLHEISHGDKTYEHNSVEGLFIDYQGNIYVVDHANHQIKLFLVT